jgi:methyl-accepting chemotaxis protein
VVKVPEQVRQTLCSIDEIVAYVQNVSDMVNRIAVAAKEQP